MTGEPVHISGVIHTLNEERNVGNAIRSLLPWVDEIVVIDMFSEDSTREVATRLGARVVLHERREFAEPARDFGLSQAHGAWIISLDADEMVPATLAARLEEIAESDEADIVRIYFNDYILGDRFSGGGWGLRTECHARFFKKGTVTFPPFVHTQEHLTPGGRIVTLAPTEELAITHFAYPNSEQVLRKLDRYTTVEAQGRYARGIKASPLRCIRAACRSFLVRYFYRLGYREGWRGLLMCMTMVMYEIAAFAKQKEIEDRAKNGPVEVRYAKAAKKLLDGYGYHSATKPRVWESVDT